MVEVMSSILVNGFKLFPEALGRNEAALAVRCLSDVALKAPFFKPVMPRTGRPFSVEMTNAGPLGWVSDKAGGYRYQSRHPVTDAPWPEIPALFLDLWAKLHPGALAPECCLVNYYKDPGAKMGLHADVDEEDFSQPILSLSLGDRALFRVGGLLRKGPTQSIRLSSGDVVSFGGAERKAFHGIDRVYRETSTLLVENGFPGGGRLNVTLRRVRRGG